MFIESWKALLAALNGRKERRRNGNKIKDLYNTVVVELEAAEE